MASLVKNSGAAIENKSHAYRLKDTSVKNVFFTLGTPRTRYIIPTIIPCGQTADIHVRQEK